MSSHSDDDDSFQESEDAGSSDEMVEDVLPVSSDNDDEQVDYEEEDRLSSHGSLKSDSEGEQSDIPVNDKAWGKKKSVYFNTDFVDEDRGRSYREDDREAAKAEEVDALDIQRQYLKNLHSSAFETSTFFHKEPAEKDVDVNVTQWESISSSEKLQVLKLKCPELISFLKNFKSELSEMVGVLTLHASKGLKYNPVCRKLMATRNQLFLQYCMNASFYLNLRAQGIDASHFPIIKALPKLKKLLGRVKQLSDEAARKMKASQNVQKSSRQKKSNSQLELQKSIDNGAGTAHEEKMSGLADENGDQETEAQLEKRAVNYKIAKNKGLLPYRKKEYRNPRVRHRMKFKKAEIRRKGQVKKPRTEISRYGGEFSGIHPNVTRSVKIK